MYAGSVSRDTHCGLSTIFVLVASKDFPKWYSAGRVIGAGGICTDLKKQTCGRDMRTTQLFKCICSFMYWDYAVV